MKDVIKVNIFSYSFQIQNREETKEAVLRLERKNNQIEELDPLLGESQFGCQTIGEQEKTIITCKLL